MRIHIDGMRGLGDCIYQSAFVRTLAQEYEVHVSTPWPELFSNIPGVYLRKPTTTLRTQLKNMARIDRGTWSTETRFDKTIKVHYGHGSNIPNDLQRIFECKPAWGLPKFKGPKVKKPYVVIRPATIRKEWPAESRGPLPEYINDVALWLKDRFHIVSVADLQFDQEWLVGDAPYADEIFHKGELTMPELLGLCQGAAAIVGGVGWIVPFGVASGVPTFTIMGGNGGSNAPGKITNSTMDLSKMAFASPRRLCGCTDKAHKCKKQIPDLKEQFNEWEQVL